MSGGRFGLDIKFVEGMKLYSRLWPGEVACSFPLAAEMPPFSRTVRSDELPFRIVTKGEGGVFGEEELAGYDTVLASGDNFRNFYLAERCRSLGTKLFYIIEYILETRLQILRLERGRSLPKRLYSMAWTLRQERHRRHAFRMADGLQANGYPAHAAYAPLNADTLLYLDNRLGERLLAGEEEMTARRGRLLAGAPLQIVHFGRLEPMKGAQDLVPVAAALKGRGVAFELHIYGTGSLEGEIAEGIAREGLGHQVVLYAPVDFETQLVPRMRADMDLFLSCHRQSDPSCAYLEAMGCGLATVGYANRMWGALSQASTGGMAVRLGDRTALAARIADLDGQRAALAETCAAARRFAGAHTAEAEFARRIAQLAGS